MEMFEGSCMTSTLAQERAGMNSLTNSGEFDKFYSKSHTFVKMVGEGKSNRAVFLVGRCGTGKSYMVLTTLKNCGLKLDKDFCYLNNHLTPLGFYEFLYKNRNKRVIVVDDVDTLLRNKNAVPLLKSILDSPTGVRVVKWTSSRALGVPNSFIFSGTLILLMNTVPKNMDVEAVLDRGWVAQVDFDDVGMANLIRSISKKPYREVSEEDRWVMSEYIINNATGENRISLRTLVKGYDLMKYTPDWKKILQQLI